VRFLRASLDGPAVDPVRVLASTNRRVSAEPLPLPANARLVDWVSYSRTMPRCAAVVCHAGHGTIALALASGVPIVACPHAGDMAETSARIRWAGAGVSLPRRFHTARGVRLAVRRLLANPEYTRRARELAAWSRRHDGAAAAADAVEELGGVMRR
jgi:UDP:flavonoid glycosyltransferase YjiC (YdhE family)